MHIGIEVKKNEVILIIVSGNRQNLSISKETKIKVGSDLVQNMIDFRNNLTMLFQEEQIEQVSLIEGSSDSSKMRIIIEYLIKEVCYQKNIRINTFASMSIKKLKEKTFSKSVLKEFKEFYKSLNLHSYSENAFAVAWRFS
jgi:hypothetical protein